MRIGIDLGGTKIAAVALGPSGDPCAMLRAATPRGYGATLDAVAGVVAELEHRCGPAAPGIGLCLPGVVDAASGTVRAVNLPWLDGQPLAADLAARLGRPVRLANDADAFALSEAVDGAAAGAEVVFGAVLGTGVGGGLAVDRRIRSGANGTAGEWGHTPLPWRAAADGPPLVCACGRIGCVETVLAGPGLAALHARHTGETVPPPTLAERAAAGDAMALATLDRHADALARALAVVVNILDPDAVVLGGGLSALPGLVERVKARWGAWTLVSAPRTRLAVARHGGEGGVRGAAWLWPESGRQGAGHVHGDGAGESRLRGRRHDAP